MPRISCRFLIASLTMSWATASVAGPEAYQLKAEATAKLGPSQSFCAIPLAICVNNGDVASLQVGSWYSGRMRAGSAVTGNYDWIRFEGQGTANLNALLCGSGFCGPFPWTVDSEPGVSQGAAAGWNTRFGLYGGQFKDPEECIPDHTGHAYTPVQVDKNGNPCPNTDSWPSQQNAYPDFEARRATHDEYNPNALLDQNCKPENVGTSISSTLLGQVGRDRRMVLMPVINCSTWQPNGKNMPVLGYACALMLSPITSPDDVVVEFRNMATESVGGPVGNCASAGTPGESGPPVPMLVK